jgi:hypothetical protein
MIDEKRLKTTPIQHIRNLIASIKDGVLIFTWYDPIDPPYHLAYDVSCTAADVDEVISRYEALVKALEAISASRERLDNGENPKDVLTTEQFSVWDTYVRDFDEKFDSGEYDLDIIYDMSKCGAPLSDEEQYLLERHYEWLETQSLKRLPKRAYSPMNLILRAKRYEYLLSHKAPKAVIDEEGRGLAEEMIIYHYCIK